MNIVNLNKVWKKSQLVMLVLETWGARLEAGDLAGAERLESHLNLAPALITLIGNWEVCKTDLAKYINLAHLCAGPSIHVHFLAVCGFIIFIPIQPIQIQYSSAVFILMYLSIFPRWMTHINAGFILCAGAVLQVHGAFASLWTTASCTQATMTWKWSELIWII